MKKQPHPFSVKIQPNAKENKIMGWHNDHLKIAIKAAPVDGKANQALVKFLADYCRIPKSSINIIHGESSPMKRIEITRSNEIILKLLEAANTITDTKKS